MTFRVIEGGGEKRNPERETAEQVLAEALREAAANVLRIIRGAGKTHVLVKQFDEVIGAAIKFKEAAGHWPPSHVFTSALAVENEADEMFKKQASGQIKQESIDRWGEDGTFDKMYAESMIQRGALQIIASKFLDQILQVRAGESEMSDGIRAVIAAREKYINSVDATRSVKIVRKKRDRKPISTQIKNRE